MSVSPSGHINLVVSGRHGIRTHIPSQAHALAVQSGQPYPATFRMYQVDSPGIEPGLPVCRTGVFPLDHEPVFSVDRMGIEPITPILQGSVASIGMQARIVERFGVGYGQVGSPMPSRRMLFE